MPNTWVDAARRVSRGLALVALTSSVAGCVTANTNIATGPPRAVHNVQMSSVAVARRIAMRHSIARHSPRSTPRSIEGGSTPRSIEGVASYYWEGSRVASGGKYNPQRPDGGASYIAVRHQGSRQRSENKPQRRGHDQRSRSIRAWTRAGSVARRGARARDGEPRRQPCARRRAVNAADRRGVVGWFGDKRDRFARPAHHESLDSHFFDGAPFLV